jgi:hypothetical protein
MKELRKRGHIDKLEYVKVVNPAASEGVSQPRYLYIPVDEYLAKKESFTTAIPRKEESRKDLTGGPSFGVSPVGQEVQVMPVSRGSASVLKTKVLVAHFDDRTPDADAAVGDWMAQKLRKRLIAALKRFFTIIRWRRNSWGARIPPAEFTPGTLRLNEVFGIEAVGLGSGPYVFTAKEEARRSSPSSK